MKQLFEISTSTCKMDLAHTIFTTKHMHYFNLKTKTTQFWREKKSTSKIGTFTTFCIALLFMFIFWFWFSSRQWNIHLSFNNHFLYLLFSSYLFFLHAHSPEGVLKLPNMFDQMSLLFTLFTQFFCNLSHFQLKTTGFFCIFHWNSWHIFHVNPMYVRIKSIKNSDLN